MPYLYILCLSLLLLAGGYLIFLGLGLPLRPLVWVGSRRILLAGFSLLALALEVGVLWLVVAKTPSPQEAVMQTYKNILARGAAAAMRSKMHFPMQVDRDIQLIDVQADDDTILNDYVITTPDTNVYTVIVGEVRKAMQATICATPDYRQIFKMGLGVKMRFQQSTTRYTETLVFMPSQCGF